VEDAMKRSFVFWAIVLLFLGTAFARNGQVSAGISVADGRLHSFYLAIGDYYRVPEVEVVAFRDRYRVQDEELPVVYFLAARSHVSPSVIIGFRSRGMSWLDITFHYGLTPQIFYVPVMVEKVGPPYGKAYGYYKKYGPAKQWKKIKLSDHEVIDLVNLRFMSEHYRFAPEAVMEMRGRGESFVKINEEGAKAKSHQKGQKGKDKKGEGGQGKGKHQ
jgi:hypothetical protein